MNLKIPLQLYDASPKNIVDLTDLENHRVQSKGRITYLSHSCLFFFFPTEKSVYAYSLKDLCSTVVGVEVKLPSFQLDSHLEKNIDHVTHLLSPLRCEVMSWRLVEWRGVVFPDRMAWWDFVLSWLCGFWTRSHIQSSGQGLVSMVSSGIHRKAKKAYWGFLFGFTVQGKKKTFKPHSKTIHGIKSLIISLSLFRFEDIRYLTKVPGLSRDNILVVDSEMAKLISTKDLHTVWTLNVSRVLR